MIDVDYLASIALFRDLPAAQRATIATRLVPQIVTRDQVLMVEGHPSDSIFFVLSGRFVAHTAGGEGPPAEIGVGEPIGEIGFFAKTPRSATVTAARDSTVLQLDRTLFDEIATMVPEIYVSILATTARRLANRTAGPQRTPRISQVRTVAMIGAGNAEIPALFIDRLRAVLSRGARVLFLSTRDDKVSAASFDDVQFSSWLNAQELDHDLIVYIADANLTEWSRTAVRQADQLITIVPDDTVRPLGAVEEYAIGIHPASNRRLVRLHAQRCEAVEGTAAHLSGRDAFIHHHVALHDEEDVESLGRFLTGRAVGFVAGGGGGLGPAHVGIFQAFEERGVKFDFVGGTSVGAAMMAGFAFRCSGQVLIDGAEDIFITSRGLKRPTWPRYALLDHINIDAALKRLYRGYNIEDTWRNYFALSTDLSMNAPYVHRSGPLWRAVRASSSIPGVLPPIYEDGHMLVDGALVDNVPLATMQKLKAGPNVVVHFGLPAFERFDVDYDSIPGRRRLMFGLLSPFHRKSLPHGPGPVEVLRRSLLANRHNTTLPVGAHDLVIQPPVFPGASFMDWSGHFEVYKASYSWAKTYIAELFAKDDPALLAVMRASGLV